LQQSRQTATLAGQHCWHGPPAVADASGGTARESYPMWLHGHGWFLAERQASAMARTVALMPPWVLDLEIGPTRLPSTRAGGAEVQGGVCNARCSGTPPRGLTRVGSDRELPGVAAGERRERGQGVCDGARGAAVLPLLRRLRPHELRNDLPVHPRPTPYTLHPTPHTLHPIRRCSPAAQLSI